MPKRIFIKKEGDLLREIFGRLRRKPQLRYLWVIEKVLDDPLPTCEARIPFKFGGL
jgi:hypothetical protein